MCNNSPAECTLFYTLHTYGQPCIRDEVKAHDSILILQKPNIRRT